jgi:hypothetical protein
MSLAQKEPAKVQKKMIVKDKKHFFDEMLAEWEKGCILGVME